MIAEIEKAKKAASELEAVKASIAATEEQFKETAILLPKDKEIQVICRSAVCAYYATRILLQNGFKARNISGGMLTRSHRAEA